ncbi:uncharacterized protein LOC134832303 [Culicoides brevitarsis]|uniref:uncharacterized protein LOC134832303 n=1 Tax=Culicoides brevitarsis TaxID=469753 RepID=UPI00307BA23F
MPQFVQKQSFEVNSYTNCVLFNEFSILNEFPSVRSDCQNALNLTKTLTWGVDHGCSLFVTSNECIDIFFDRFLEIHDMANAKYEKKVLVIVDFHTEIDVLRTLGSEMVTRWIPLTLVLQPHHSGQWINIYSGFGSDVNRFFIENSTLEHDKPLIPQILTDFGGKEIVTALFEYPPFVSIAKVDAGMGNANLFGSNETLSIKLQGFEALLMVEFCRIFNCVISARLEYDEDMWGWGFRNHTGYGIMGAILKYDADLTAAGCYLMHDRYELIQYSYAIQRSSVIHILPKPKPLPLWNIPLLPFSAVIWKNVAIVLTTVAIFIFILNRIQVRYLPKFSKNSTLIVVQMSLFQNVERLNYSTATNSIIYGTFLIYSIMIGNFYIGGLSSIMTVTPYEPPIDSLEKLISSNLKWGGNTISWTYAIKESSDPNHQKYVSKFIVPETEDLQKLIKDEKIAVALDRTQAGTASVHNLLTRDDSKHLMIMKERLYAQYSVLIASKTFPYMEQLNKMAFWQQESGIREIWEYETVVRKMDYVVQRNLVDNMKPPTNKEPVKLSVPHIFGAGFILLFGYLFATIAFAAEIFHSKYVRRVKKN